MKDPHALIVIDVQNGFISDYTRRSLPRIHQLLAEDFDVVIATRFSNPEGSPFRRLIHWHKLSSSPEIDLDPQVEARADVIIDKHTYGAGEEILDELTRRGIRTATVVGIDTDVCVLQNSAYLFDHGITVYVDLEGCATNGGPAADEAARVLLGRTIGVDQVRGRLASAA